MAQLRAGHCPQTRYYQHRIGMREDRICESCGEEETKDHWLDCGRVMITAKGEDVRLETLTEEGRLGRLLQRHYPKWWDPGGS